MKSLPRHAVFFLSFAALLFISCENEPLEGEFVNTPPGGGSVDLNVDITGVWDFVGYEVTSVSTGEIAGQNFDQIQEIVGSNFNAQMEFSLPNTYTSSGTMTLTITTTFMGETTTLTETEDVSESGTWSQNGTILSLNDGTDSFDLQIIALTENLMVLFYEVNEVVGGLQVEITETITLSR